MRVALARFSARVTKRDTKCGWHSFDSLLLRGRAAENVRGARSILSLSTQAGDNAAFRAEHKTLGKIFNWERDFLFTAQKNVRSYEWTSEEAEELLESIVSLQEDDQLELNSITLMEKSMDKED
jgi:hypothetical protein